MTRTISLITATVGTALLFAIPAYGDSWGMDKGREPVRVSPDLEDRAIVAEQIRLARMLDARERSLEVAIENRVQPVDRERALGTKNELMLSSDFYADGFAQALQPNDSRPEPVRDDRFRLNADSTPTVTATSSSRDIELPQVGIGFGLGLVLAIGLFLVMRYTRGRQLAH